MNILFLGNFEAPYSSENNYKETLEKLGHKVFALQEKKATGRVITAFNGIDLFIWIHTHGWNTEGISDALTELRKRNVPIITYHLDLWMGLAREKEMTEDYFKVDHFFTVDKAMAEWLNKNTKTKGHYLAAGAVESECLMGTANKEKFPHEIVFTGSKNYHPEYSYRATLINWLHQTYGSSFAHYGSGGLQTIRGKELNDLYASAKIVIGDTLCKNFTYENYFSDRYFEVPSRGGFMIAPYINGIEDYYDIGKEIVTYTYGDFTQLKKLIDHFLVSDSEREEIRNAGYERAKQDHNYTERWKTILKTIFEK